MKDQNTIDELKKLDEVKGMTASSLITLVISNGSHI